MNPSRPAEAAGDVVGAATLERIATAPRFNRWMYDRLSRWIGRRVLEVGSGIGNMSQFFCDRERVVLTDTEPQYRERLRARFGGLPHLTVAEVMLPHETGALRDETFDTIVCLNVLEHVEDDEASLAALKRLLAPQGHLVLLVPAVPFLYGTLDRALGHHRRYTPRSLRDRFRDAGLSLRHLEYFNLAGMPGWWFAGRVLRRRLIPAGALRAYDALVPLFRCERFLPWRLGQSLIAIGQRPA